MDLTRDPLPGLVARIAIPASMALFFQTFFNIGDTFWAGAVSTDALAALAVSFPVFFLVISASAGFGWASNALIARALGAGDRERARTIWIQAMLLGVAVGFGIALVGILLAAPLLQLMGASGPSLELATAYLRAVMMGAPVFLMMHILNARLAAAGDTRPFRDAIMVGALANIALNPLLIFGVPSFVPGMGFAGIAVSTLAIIVAQSVWLAHRCRGVLGEPWPSPGELKPRGFVLWQITRQSVPMVMTMISIGIGLATITHFMGRYGVDAVAAYGIGLRIEQLVMLPVVGMNAAALSLIGQNLGAGDISRVRASARFILLTGLGFAIIGGVAIFALRGVLLATFSDDVNVQAIGAGYLIVGAINAPAYALLILSTAVLQGLGKPELGFVVAFLRHVAAPIVVISLIDAWLNWGIFGIYLGLGLISWIGAALIIAILVRVLKDLGSRP